MSVIWKAQIWPKSDLLPLDAKLLHVDHQGRDAYVWFETSGHFASMVKTRIRGVVTGAEPPKDSEYIGTVLLDEGGFVLHFYDTMRRQEAE